MKLKLTCVIALAIAGNSQTVAASPTTFPTHFGIITRSSNAQDQNSFDSVARINVADLQKLLSTGDVVIIDVRPTDQYAAGHIKGARSSPVTDIEARASELPRDRMIVTYCA